MKQHEMIYTVGVLLGIQSAGVATLAAQEAQIPQIPTVTLDEAVRRAQEALPNVVQARSSVRTAEAQVRSAKGAYLPNLSANSSAASNFSAGPSFTNNTG